MAKYNELITEFSAEIESIKSLKDREAEINSRLTVAYEGELNNAYEIERETLAIENELANLQSELHSALSALSHEVEMSYWEVPYAKPRNQGIAKFWELSGLE